MGTDERTESDSVLSRTVPPALDDDVIAGLFATALVSMPEWVHRRVESIAFTDAAAVRRRVSVDFTVPEFMPCYDVAGGSVALVPLAYLAKRPVVGLDVHDEAGVAVPVLTTEQNALLASSALRSLALAFAAAAADVAIVGGSSAAATAQLEDHLRGITREQPREAQVTFDDLSRYIESDELPALLRPLRLMTEFLAATRPFVENFVLIAVVPAEAYQRRILKFSYVESLAGESDTRGTLERITDSVGWTPQTFHFDVPGAALASSFHVEVTTPEGINVTEGALYGDQVSVHQTTSREGEAVLHLLAPRGAGADLQLKVNLRVARVGWLRVASSAVLLTTLLLVATWLRLGALEASRSGTDAAALLLGFSALIAAVIIRPGEHALTARLIVWARAIALVAIGLPIVAAYLLAFGPEGSALARWWFGLAGLSTVTTCVLWRAYAGRKLLVTATIV